MKMGYRTLEEQADIWHFWHKYSIYLNKIWYEMCIKTTLKYIVSRLVIKMTAFIALYKIFCVSVLREKYLTRYESFWSSLTWQ